MRVLKLLLLLPLAACFALGTNEEGPKGIIGVNWQLVSLDGAPLPAPASINFEADGRVNGQAPCNRFFGMQSAALPSLSIGALGATRMACPHLDAEERYFEALNAVTHVAREGTNLVLSGPYGARMIFKSST